MAFLTDILWAFVSEEFRRTSYFLFTLIIGFLFGSGVGCLLMIWIQKHVVRPKLSERIAALKLEIVDKEAKLRQEIAEKEEVLEREIADKEELLKQSDAKNKELQLKLRTVITYEKEPDSTYGD